MGDSKDRGKPGGSVVSAGEQKVVQPEGPLDFQNLNQLQQLLMSQSDGILLRRTTLSTFAEQTISSEVGLS